MSGPDLSSLRACFQGRLLTGVDATPFLTDWRRKWQGRAAAVVQPDTAQDVAAAVQWCAHNRVPIVPQGGNTGLSGGATPDATGAAIVLSLTRLNRIRGVDPVNNTIVAEAGVTLQSLQEAARDVGRLFPLSLAAEGTCTVGGNLATNAGGVHVLRYGNARELCLGLEVVTPQGELWNGLRGLRKDNTGYDLRDLYVGSEGTLGVITAATLKLFPVPASQIVCFVAVPSPNEAVALLEVAQAQLGARLTAFELVSEACLGLVEKHVPGARRPLTDVSPWYVLLEVSDSEDEIRAMTSVETLLSCAIGKELATDAAISSSVAQLRALWALREDVSEAQAAEGSAIKHDISLPISRIAEFVQSQEQAIAQAFPGMRLVVFGHVGDGNLHFNLSPPEGADAGALERFAASEAALNRLVHDAVALRGGSISAEHGLGVLRRDEARRYKSDVEMRLMRTIKAALDPAGLMNPGKLLTA